MSRLKTIKTYLKSTQKDRRLNGLAMMRIHYEADVNVIEVVDEFAKKFKTNGKLRCYCLASWFFFFFLLDKKNNVAPPLQQNSASNSPHCNI